MPGASPTSSPSSTTTPATSGRIRFDGHDLADPGGAGLAAVRRDAALVFQDHDNALNPRLTVGRALAEAQLHAPGYTLRGGTNEILKGIVARGLGLR